MKNIHIQTKEGTVSAPNRVSVKVSPNPTRTSVWVDASGNEIDRRTKKIIKPIEDK